MDIDSSKAVITSSSRDDVKTDIFIRASEFMFNRMGAAMQKTIHSKMFLEELKSELIKNSKKKNVDDWIDTKAEVIAKACYSESYDLYKKDMLRGFRDEPEEKVKRIEKNAVLAFIKTRYIIENKIAR